MCKRVYLLLFFSFRFPDAIPHIMRRFYGQEAKALLRWTGLCVLDTKFCVPLVDYGVELNRTLHESPETCISFGPSDSCTSLRSCFLDL